MLAIYATVALAAVSSVSAAPFYKRIAQVISDSTTQWEQACLAAGGGQQCNPLSIQAFSTLLAAPGPCEQQDSADDMIDLAHQLNNDSEMIRLTQLFVQQPRNSPDSVSVLYCETAPRNSELNGLFQCQFQGVNDNVFTGQVPLEQSQTGDGTIPFALSSPVSPPGSCPANPGGKIPDGEQLNTIVSDPGVGVSSGSNNTTTPPPATSTPAAETPTSETSPEDTPAASPPAASPSPASETPSGSSFQVSNAQQAQAQNIQFQSVTAGSSCTDGEVSCAGTQFAQCVSGAFVTSDCAAGTQCMALPLVNKVGTSVTCDTLADAAIRFSAISGGFDGNH